MRRLTFVVIFFAIVFSAFAQDQQQKAVHFKKLQEYLPAKDIPGYKRGKPTGSTNNSMGFSISEAVVRYVMSTDTMEYSFEIKITDMSGAPMAAWAMAFQQMDYENETDEGYEKTVKIKNVYKGIEKAHTGDSKSCSLEFAVGNRFHIEIESSGTDDAKTLHELAESMNLEKLATLTTESK